MEFRIPEYEAKRLVDLAGLVAERRSHDPHVGRVLLEAKGDVLRLVVTDRETTLRALCGAEVTRPGAAALDVGLLRAVFEDAEPKPEERAAPFLSARFSSGPSGAQVTIERGSTTYVLPRHSGGALPSLVTPAIDEAVEISTAPLRAILEATLATVCRDDTRVGLNGVRLEVHGREGGGLFRAVSTDGHRLSLCEREILGAQPAQPPTSLPRKGAAVLERLLAEQVGRLRFSLRGARAVFGLGWASITMDAVPGEFPEYEQIVPGGWTTQAVVRRLEFAEAVRSVVVLAAERSASIGVRVADGAIRLRARQEFVSDGVYAEARQTVTAEVEGPGIEVGLNGRYFAEAIDSLRGEVVRIELGSALSPIVLRPVDSLDYVVLMPMRLEASLPDELRPRQPSPVGAAHRRPKPKKRRRSKKRR